MMVGLNDKEIKGMEEVLRAFNSLSLFCRLLHDAVEQRQETPHTTSWKYVAEMAKKEIEKMQALESLLVRLQKNEEDFWRRRTADIQRSITASALPPEQRRRTRDIGHGRSFLGRSSSK